jgi:hypothetical protein
MKTAAMVLGVIPLITASGAGAVSRFNMSLVIACGLSIGTLFTLFVVPAIYLLLATDHSHAARSRVHRASSPACRLGWCRTRNLTGDRSLGLLSGYFHHARSSRQFSRLRPKRSRYRSAPRCRP